MHHVTSPFSELHVDNLPIVAFKIEAK